MGITDIDSENIATTIERLIPQDDLDRRIRLRLDAEKAGRKGDANIPKLSPDELIEASRRARLGVLISLRMAAMTEARDEFCILARRLLSAKTDADAATIRNDAHEVYRASDLVQIKLHRRNYESAPGAFKYETVESYTPDPRGSWTRKAEIALLSACLPGKAPSAIASWAVEAARAARRHVEALRRAAGDEKAHGGSQERAIVERIMAIAGVSDDFAA